MNVLGGYDNKMTGLEVLLPAGENSKRHFYIPEELVLHIFGFLNATERFQKGSVCKRWLNMTKNPLLHEYRLSLNTSDEYAAALSEIFLNRSLSAYRSYVYEDVLRGTIRVENLDKMVSLFISTSILFPHFIVNEVITRKVKIDLCAGIVSKVTNDIKDLICKKKVDLEGLTNPLEWKYRCRYWNFFLAKYEIKIFKKASFDLSLKIILYKCLDKLNLQLLKKPILLRTVQQYIPIQEILNYYMD